MSALPGSPIALSALRQESVPDSNVIVWAQAMPATLEARTALARRDAAAALAITSEWLPRIEPIEPQSGEDRIWRTAMLYFLYDLQAHAQYALGHPADSERSARASLAAREKWSAGGNFDKTEKAVESMVIARALVAQGKHAEAAELMKPVVAHFRDLDSHNQGDLEARAWLASALFMQGLAEPTRRAALNAEGCAILRDVPPDYRRLAYLRTWLDLAGS